MIFESVARGFSELRAMFFYRLKGSRYKEIIQRKTIIFPERDIKLYIYLFFLLSLREDLPILPIFLR